MSPEERFHAFKRELEKKNLLPSEITHFSQSFRKLVITRRLSELAISILLIFGGQLFVIQNAFFCPVWVGTGVALSGVFLRGHFILLGIFLGSLASYLNNHYPLFVSFLQSGLFTLYIYSIRLCSLHFIGPVTPIPSRSVLGKFLLLIMVLTAIDVIAIYFIFKLTTTISISWKPFFLNAFSGQLNGILCLTPLCLIFEPFIPEKYFKSSSSSWWISALFLISLQFLYFLFPQCWQSILLSLCLVLSFFVYGKIFGQFPTGMLLLGVAIVYLGATSSTALFKNACSPTLHLLFLNLMAFSALYSATSHQEKVLSNT